MKKKALLPIILLSLLLIFGCFSNLTDATVYSVYSYSVANAQAASTQLTTYGSAIAVSFSGDGYFLTHVDFPIRNSTASMSGNIIGAIFSDPKGANPIENSTNQINLASFSYVAYDGNPTHASNYVNASFDFDGHVQLNNGVTYWIAIVNNGTIVGYIFPYHSSGSGYDYRSGTGSSWSTSSSKTVCVAVYSSSVYGGEEAGTVSCTFSQGTGGNIFYHDTDLVNHGAGTYSLALNDLLVIYMVPSSGYYSGFFSFNNGTQKYLGDSGVGMDVNGYLYMIMSVTAAFNCTAYFSNTPLTPSNVTHTFVLDTLGMGDASWMYYSGFGGGTSYPSGIYQTYNIAENTTIQASTTVLSGYHLSYWDFNNGTFVYDDGSGTILVKIVADTHLTAIFVSNNGTTYPTATPTPGGFNLGQIKTDFTSLLEILIGIILTIAGIAILLRAKSAWVIGLILFVIGFFLQIIVNQSYLSLIVFTFESTIATTFLLTRSGSKNK
jgi:hypothetical protein